MVRRSQNFSVSQEYEEVWEILDQIENKSQFICEAIINYQHNLDKADENLPDKDALKDMVQELLNDMIGSDVFLVKGNPDDISISASSGSKVEEQNVLNESSFVEEEVKEENQEEKDNIKSIVDGLITDESALDAARNMFNL